MSGGAPRDESDERKEEGKLSVCAEYVALVLTACKG